MKKSLLVLSLSALLVLSSCGNGANSSSSNATTSNEATTSNSQSVTASSSDTTSSNSTDSSSSTSSTSSSSSSSSSNPTPVVDETPYQVSADAFFKFFYGDALTNCTLDFKEDLVHDEKPSVTDQNHYVYQLTPSLIHNVFTYPDGSISTSTSSLNQGQLAEFNAQQDSTGWQASPYLRLHQSETAFFFDSRSDIIERFFAFIDSPINLSNYSDAQVQVFLKHFYGDLVYQASDHTYTLKNKTKGYGMQQLSLSFKDGKLLSASGKRYYSDYQEGDAMSTFSATFSNFGSTTITLDSETQTGLTVHKLTCYDDNDTLMGYAYLQNSGNPVYDFVLGKKATDDTGAYVFAKWDKDTSTITADTTLKASFTLKANADLYEMQSGVLSFKNLSEYPTSIKIPETFVDNGSTVSVTSFDLGSDFSTTSRLSDVTLNASLKSLSVGYWGIDRNTSFDTNGNAHFKVVGHSLYSADGTILYSLNAADMTDTTSLPSGLVEIMPYACADGTMTAIEFPSSLTTIDECAFEQSSLESVTLPSNMVSLGSNAFNQCEALTSLTMDDKLTSIDDYAFNKDAFLSEVHVSSALASLGDSVFASCSSLSSFAFSDTLTSVGESCFAETGFTSLALPKSASAWSSAIFRGCVWLTSVSIPKEITKLSNQILADESRLSQISFEAGSTLQSIGDYAFCYDSALTSLDFSSFSQLTSIGTSAFAGDIALTSIILPTSLTSVGEHCFQKDAALSIYSLATSVPSFTTDWNVLDSDASPKTYVPTYAYAENKPESNPTSYWHYVNNVPTAYNA